MFLATIKIYKKNMYCLMPIYKKNDREDISNSFI